MANRKQANIPKFGEWKDGGGISTPYTVVFDDARFKKEKQKNKPDDHSQNQGSVRERLIALKPNTEPPRQTTGGRGERREEKRYPPRTPSPANGHPGDDALVPKFGVWNDTNPRSRYDFTGEFQRAGEERNRERNPGAATPSHNDQIYDPPYEKETMSHHSTGTCRCAIL